MANSVEAAKQHYSKELAAYTLRQWNNARRSLELAQENRRNSRAEDFAKGSHRHRSPQIRSTPDSTTQDAERSTDASYKAIDYAANTSGSAAS